MNITPHEFNLAADAFYCHPDDPALNEQGNRREKLRAALAAVGVTIIREAHPALELHPVEEWPVPGYHHRFITGQKAPSGWRTGCPTCRTDGPCPTRVLLLKGDSDA